MRSGKGLIGFAFFVALITVYVFLDYQWGEKKKEKKEKSSLLFPFDIDDAEEILLKKSKPKKDTYTFKKEQGKWHLQSPIKDLADQDEVKGMLRQLLREKHKNIANEGSNLNWSLYGLDGLLSSVFVRLADKRSFHVFVGSKENFQGNSFLKREVDGKLDQKVYTGTGAWKRYLRKELKNYRDRHLLREPISNINKIQFSQKPQAQAQATTWVLVKEKEFWKNPEHKEWNLSSSDIHSKLLDKLEGLKLDEVFSESKTSIPSWESSAWSYRLSFQDGTSWEAYFSKAISPKSNAKAKEEDKNVHVWIPKRKRVYVAAHDTVKPLKNLKLVDFRDKKEPFQFDKDGAALISADWKLKKAELKRKEDGTNWVWYEQGKKYR